LGRLQQKDCEIFDEGAAIATPAERTWCEEAAMREGFGAEPVSRSRVDSKGRLRGGF
jgi:hypothetical protein